MKKLFNSSELCPVTDMPTINRKNSYIELYHPNWIF